MLGLQSSRYGVSGAGFSFTNEQSHYNNGLANLRLGIQSLIPSRSAQTIFQSKEFPYENTFNVIRYLTQRGFLVPEPAFEAINFASLAPLLYGRPVQPGGTYAGYSDNYDTPGYGMNINDGASVPGDSYYSNPTGYGDPYAAGQYPGGYDQGYGQSYDQGYGSYDQGYGQSYDQGYGGYDQGYGQSYDQGYGGYDQGYGQSYDQGYGGYDQGYAAMNDPYGGFDPSLMQPADYTHYGNLQHQTQNYAPQPMEYAGSSYGNPYGGSMMPQWA